MPKYIVFDPNQSISACRLRIRPTGNAYRGFQGIRDTDLIEELFHTLRVLVVPFNPSTKMFLGSEEIAFISVALLVSQNKVVTLINRILLPRDEMIHLAPIAGRLVTVEACVLLNFDKDGTVDV